MENNYMSRIERNKRFLSFLKEKVFILSRIWRLSFLLVIAIGFMFVGSTIGHAYDSCDRKVIGTVVEYEKTSVVKRIKVSYEIDGEEYETDTFSSSDKRYHVGDEIKLYYDPAEPDIVVDKSNFYVVTGRVLGVIGVVIVIFTVLPLAREYLAFLPEIKKADDDDYEEEN